LLKIQAVQNVLQRQNNSENRNGKIEFDRTMMTVDCAVETGEK